MRKTIIAIAIAIATIATAGYVALKPEPAKCSLCYNRGKRCMFDTDCDISCVCIKRDYELNGVCF